MKQWIFDNKNKSRAKTVKFQICIKSVQQIKNISQWNGTLWNITRDYESGWYVLEWNVYKHENTLCNVVGVEKWDWGGKKLKWSDTLWNSTIYDESYLEILYRNGLQHDNTLWNLMGFMNEIRIESNKKEQKQKKIKSKPEGFSLEHERRQ